jgi:hypothetical protein
LNIVNGPRGSFKYIEPMSLKDLLVNGHPNVGRIEIIDARYPYEFKGGHIKGALNVASQVRENAVHSVCKWPVGNFPRVKCSMINFKYPN